MLEHGEAHTRIKTNDMLDEHLCVYTRAGGHERQKHQRVILHGFYVDGKKGKLQFTDRSLKHESFGFLIFP